MQYSDNGFCYLPLALPDDLDTATLVWKGSSSPLVKMPKLRHFTSNMHYELASPAAFDATIKVFALAACMFNVPSLMEQLETAEFHYAVKDLIPYMTNVHRLAFYSPSKFSESVSIELEALSKLTRLDVSPRLACELQTTNFKRMEIVNRTDLMIEPEWDSISETWNCWQHWSCKPADARLIGKMRQIACPLEYLADVSRHTASTLVRIDVLCSPKSAAVDPAVFSLFEYPSLLDLTIRGKKQFAGQVRMPKLKHLAISEVSSCTLRLFSSITTLESATLRYVRSSYPEEAGLYSELVAALLSLQWRALTMLHLFVNDGIQTDAIAWLDLTLGSLHLRQLETLVVEVCDPSVFCTISLLLKKTPTLRRLVVGADINLLSSMATHDIIRSNLALVPQCLEYLIFNMAAHWPNTKSLLGTSENLIKHTPANSVILLSDRASSIIRLKANKAHRHTFFEGYFVFSIRD